MILMILMILILILPSERASHGAVRPRPGRA
jgi:hypothetical protein